MLPCAKAASELGVPTAVHESNAVPGLTTKMLEGSVDTIMVGFEESRANYRHPDRVEVTGTPCAWIFLNPMTRPRQSASWAYPRGGRLVVSVWGSLGAAHMKR